jgi:hypothetical protein
MATFKVGDRVRRLPWVGLDLWTAGGDRGYITAVTGDGYQVRFDDGVEASGYREDELERVEENDPSQGGDVQGSGWASVG